MSMAFVDILDAVEAERALQDARHDSTQNTWPVWVVILGEEMGGVARAILEWDTGGLIRECIQVIAVAVAIQETEYFGGVARDEVMRLIAGRCDAVRHRRRDRRGCNLPWWYAQAQYQFGQWAGDMGALTALNTAAAVCVHLIEIAEGGNVEWR